MSAFRIVNMQKTSLFKKSLKSILVIWFFLCIFPGDCFLLHCAEKEPFFCAEKEPAILSHKDADSSIPSCETHCPNCCVLCVHNLVMHLCQNPSFTLTSLSSRFKIPQFNYF